MPSVTENLQHLYSELNDGIDLIAVSKKQPDNLIIEALEAGHRSFGENRVQDALDRWPDLKQRYKGITLHMIGHLQSNKVKDAVSLFDTIHTVDRPKLAKALAKEIKAQDKALPCFIQVNTGKEDQKSGVLPDDLDDLYNLCRDLDLNITGLMCIPPVNEAAGLHFALLRKLARRLGLENLSMGMSQDYHTAVAFGATHIRIGHGIFGDRTS